MKSLDSRFAAVESKSRARRAEQSSLSPAPLLPDVGVLALVPDHWHWQWQPRHQVMTRLARYFSVVWMNPAEDWRCSVRPDKWFVRREETPMAGNGFVVHTPSPLLPLFYSPRWLAKLTFRRRLENARRLLVRQGCKKIVLYLWRPEFAAAIDSIPYDFCCYHIDDEYSFSSVDIPISDVEARLLGDADQVFIHSPGLLEKKGRINPHTLFVPNGVDFELYSKPIPEPRDLAGVPHPRIGYSGHIKKQLDWQLLLELTARHPEWFFVFVGAPNAHPEIVAHIDQLSRRTNVRFLGGKSSHELAAYAQHFDVCVMPYVQDSYTQYIYPLKLHEYLASGRPVVGAPIASLKQFGEFIFLPDTSDRWSAAIAESLAPASNTPERREVRRNLARQHDWNLLVRQIAETLGQRLGPPYSSFLAQSSQEAFAGSSQTEAVG
jgi:glycosyltransferase involved in cell wall biosynthesis